MSSRYRGHRPPPGGRRTVAAVSFVAVIVVLLGLVSPAGANDIHGAQWQLGFLRVDEAWKHSTGRGAVVAVIDSGVDADHPDLTGRVLAGRDFVDGASDGRYDAVGHGTGVASLIAGEADANGVTGIAPDVAILPIRVLDERNEYDSASVIASAVRWAVDHGADVINLSLGSGQFSRRLSEALGYAAERDVVVVACTGNVSNRRGNRVWHPAREPGVVAATGVTKQGDFWKGSLADSTTVISAPATEIVAADIGGKYQTLRGTSFAAPLVPASAVLVRAAHPELNAATVVQRLISTAWDYGTPGRDEQFGYGIVNPTRAVTARVPAVAQNPLRDQSGAHATADVPTASNSGPEQPGKPGPIDSAGPREQEGLSTPQLLLLAGVAVAVLGVLCCLAGILRRRRSREGQLNRSPGYSLQR